MLKLLQYTGKDFYKKIANVLSVVFQKIQNTLLVDENSAKNLPEDNTFHACEDFWLFSFPHGQPHSSTLSGAFSLRD